jgi:uncharacterized protein YndB with AHSA1/START domain
MSRGATIEQSITIHAPRSEVFRALTEPARLERWMATSAESEPRTGGRFRYSFEFDDASQNNTQEGEYPRRTSGLFCLGCFPSHPSKRASNTR